MRNGKRNFRRPEANRAALLHERYGAQIRPRRGVILDVNLHRQPPRAGHKPQSRTDHGITRNDNYSWLRADNWQQVMHEPHLLPVDIREYLEAENRYTDAVMADTKEFQDKLFQELKGRIKQDDTTVPAPTGPSPTTSAMSPERSTPATAARTASLTSPETVLLDGPAGSGRLGLLQARRLVAQSRSRAGRLVRATSKARSSSPSASATCRPDGISRRRSRTRPATSPGRPTAGSFFYVENDENHRPCRVWHHASGAGAGRPAGVSGE